MADAFKYVFVKTKSSWVIGSSHSSLSFSSDGTTIAGTKAAKSPDYPRGKVDFWETATGTITSSFNDWSFVVFSPTDPDMGAVVGPNGTQMVKRKSPGGKTWHLRGKSLGGHEVMCTFSPDGKRIMVMRTPDSDVRGIYRSLDSDVRGTYGSLYEYDLDDNYKKTTVEDFLKNFAYCPIEPKLCIVGYDGLTVTIQSYPLAGRPRVHCQLTPVSVGVCACAWSQDGKWIATGDNVGDVYLWDASVTTSVPLERLLPRVQSGPITSLIFVPDSTALMIICRGYLSVWDIARGVYVANSGLPAKAVNIALDGPRNRVAVAVDNKISLYELELPQQTIPSQTLPSQTLPSQTLPSQTLPTQTLPSQTLPSQTLPSQTLPTQTLPSQTLPGQQKPPHYNRQTQGKPLIPSELVEFDITNNVVKSRPDPFVSIYFDIYRGVWNLDIPRVFQHVVAIKAVRPSFNPRSKAQERLNFEHLLTKCLIRWWNLSHDNLVPLLGVSMDFGRFPAMVISWMANGSLSEYIKSDEKYDKMELVIGVARGVAYLHSKGIIHSDIRASSVLVDELGNARLADPGLLSVLTSSPLMLSGKMNVSYYRWMAPELLGDSSPKSTFATDVYSVTMTSLEIFTARHPFEGVNDALVPGQVLQNHRPDRPQDVGDVLWSLWNDGWNQDPAKRPDMASYVGHLNGLM